MDPNQDHAPLKKWCDNFGRGMLKSNKARRAFGVNGTEDNRRILGNAEMYQCSINCNDDVILYGHSIILNIRVRGYSGGSLRKNWTKSTFSSTSNSSDSDDRYLLHVYIFRQKVIQFRSDNKATSFKNIFQWGWKDWSLWAWWKIMCDKQWTDMEITRSGEISGMFSRVEAKIVAIRKCTIYPYWSDELHLNTEMR